MSVVEESKLDAATVAAVYRRHGDELRRFLVGLLRDVALAGDVLQAAFVKLAESGHRSAPETRKAWLFRVAYHEAMAVRRRESVDRRAVERVAWTKSTCHGAADEPLVRAETIDRVRAALDELPEPQARIVRMRIYEEKTFARIAEELDIPLGTALGRMRSAMEKLRRRLSNA